MVISKLINFSTNWLINIFGSSSENFLNRAINLEEFEIKKSKGEEVYGVLCYMDTTKLSEYLATLIEDEHFIPVYNTCLSLIHNEITLLRGEVFSRFPGKYTFVWHFNDEELFKDINFDNEFVKLRTNHLRARAELAFTAVASAIFKLRTFLRNYTYRDHD